MSGRDRTGQLAALLLLAAMSAAAAQSATLADPVAAGRWLYEGGILPSGEPVRAERAGMTLTGADAACVVCHRESGMGAYEGTRVVPPVAGRVLYQPVTHDEQPRRGRTPEFSARYVHARPAYSVEALGHALRDGVNAGGDALGWLMPRYQLDGEALAALDAYLRTLSAGTAAGVDAEAVHFATVISPDTVPERAEMMLEVLGSCLDEQMAAQRQERGSRAWKLHVWRLDGPPATWDAQLAAAHARQPVFALVSGISERGWGAMARFCERGGVPCLFPNTDLPQAASGSSTMYFSGGVELEARVMARRLREAAMPPARIVQVFRDGELGADAARALAAALEGSHIAIETRALGADAPLDAPALRAGQNDALVLWLLAKDVARLPGAPPRAAGGTYVSGTLGGLDAMPLPERWRAASLIVYPMDLPAARRARLEYSLDPWLQQHAIAPRDERLQGNTLAACRLLAEGMARVRDIYVPRYLLESIEISMGNAAASTPFPRFTLGAGQRFGSKGAYIVKLGAGGTITPQGGWIVP